MQSRTAPYSPQRAYTIWIAGLIAYIVAVVHRTSLGVTGLEAASHFGTTASQLALFTVTQLVVYSAAQIPVGVLLDRYGARRLIATGALMMAVGQLGMAFAESIPVALGARVLIGAGDATTFVSVLRLIAAWFPPMRAPVLGQITGQIAQAGQIISAVPFVYFLHKTTWTTAFAVLGILGVIASVWAFYAIVDQPQSAPGGAAKVRIRPIDRVPHDPTSKPLAGALRTAGSWLGFWTHMVTAFSFNVFVFLWGKPFLILGQGLSEQQVSLVFTVMTCAGIFAGPLFGLFCARHPLRRTWLVFTVAIAVAASWSVLLLPSTPRPFIVIVIATFVIATGGPASLVGLDFARTSNPTSRLGVGSGIANMGGFVGGFVCIMAIGIVLDVVRPTGAYTLNDFRMAFSVMLVPLVVGLIGVAWSKRGTRREYAQRGIVVPPARDAWRTYRKK